MNSLNNDSASLNQAKYRPLDVPNQYYQQNLFYRLPNNTNITPEFASLQSAYGANQLLATQFSFQYSDNQGLGEGLTVGNNGGPWATGGVSQSRAAGSLDPNHFYSLPSHGPAQTADQSLFYPYGFSATNNVYWQHPSVLEYKSTGQNFALPATEKPQTWPDSLVNGQYSPLGNTLTYKSNIPLLDHNNQALNANNTQSNFDVQLGSNGYHIGQVAGKVLAEEALSAAEDRTSHRKSDNNTSNQDMVYTSSNNPNEINHELISLEAHLVKNCSLHNDNNNGSNISQHPYSVPSFSKQSLNNNAVSDYWSNDVNKLTNYNAAKSYAKAAKLSSRSVTQLSNSNSSSYYMDNGYNSNGSRCNYKSQTNGFATGFVRPSNVNNNWGNNPPSNGASWNTSRSKWNQDISRGQLGHVVPDTSKSSWPSKGSIPNSDEHLRNAEYRIKEIQTQINPKRLDINFEKTRYFVIKSYSEDDVHRSIKYKIWCSTKEGNRRLNEAFQGAQKNGGSILLFFSVNGSGHFCGVAEMISSVDESVVTGVWCQDKWRGKFSVKWLFVKDVPNTQLRHITTKVKIQKGNGETTNEIKPITNLRDATELKSDRSPGSTFKDDIGYQALKIIMECKSTMSIFDDFLHYEKRELGIDSAN